MTSAPRDGRLSSDVYGEPSVSEPGLETNDGGEPYSALVASALSAVRSPGMGLAMEATNAAFGLDK